MIYKINDPIEIIQINIGENAVGKEGAMALSEALKTNHTLTQLNLSKWYIK